MPMETSKPEFGSKNVGVSSLSGGWRPPIVPEASSASNGFFTLAMALILSGKFEKVNGMGKGDLEFVPSRPAERVVFSG